MDGLRPVPLCAQIRCFFLDEDSVNRALGEFEKKLKANWFEIAKKQNIDPISFPFIKAQNYREGLGLKWPIPERRFTQDEKFYNLGVR